MTTTSRDQRLDDLDRRIRELAKDVERLRYDIDTIHSSTVVDDKLRYADSEQQ